MLSKLLCEKTTCEEINMEAKVRRGIKATETQKICLIDFLGDRPDLANDRFKTSDGAQYRDSEWNMLSVELNALGGAIKNGVKWRKYWKDLTISVRNRQNAIKEQRHQKGVNGNLRIKKLSVIDHKIITIIQAAKKVDWSLVKETSFTDGQNESTMDFSESKDEEFLIEQITPSPLAIHSTSKRQTRNRTLYDSTDDSDAFNVNNQQMKKGEQEGVPTGFAKEMGFDYCVPKFELIEEAPGSFQATPSIYSERFEKEVPSSSSTTTRQTGKIIRSDSTHDEDAFELDKGVVKIETVEGVSSFIVNDIDFDYGEQKEEMLEEASESRPVSPPVHFERFEEASESRPVSPPIHFERSKKASVSRPVSPPIHSEIIEEAIPSSSTTKKQNRKRTLTDSTDDVFKFYKEMELKKLKLKERKIELIEQSNHIQMGIKSKLDQLLQELQNKK